MTGFVAATGQSYLCPDTAHDPLYLEGAAGARSSLTVPLIYHGTVIGTLNVENAAAQRLRRPRPPVPRDLRPERRLGAEHAGAAPGREVQRGDRLGRGDQPRAGAAARRHPERRDDGPRPLRRPRRGHHRPAPAPALPRPRDPQPDPEGRLDDRPRAEAERRRGRRSGWPSARLLVVDADEAIRRSAHHLLGCQGATVETARDAHEAIALARQTPYSAALVDIRLPDLDGFETYRRLREVQPGVPIILMTGFGYDPSHSIVKARQEGLQTVLYKPFRADRLHGSRRAGASPGRPPPSPRRRSAPPSPSPPTAPPTATRAAARRVRPPRPPSMSHDWLLSRPRSPSATLSPGRLSSTSPTRSGFASESWTGSSVLLLAPDARHDGGHRLGGLAGAAGRPGRGPRRPTRWPAWRSRWSACPASTLVRIFRRTPAGISGRDAEIDLAERTGPRR